MRQDLHRIRNAHRTMRRVAHWLRICPEPEVGEAYLAVLKATERAFALEQALMEACAYPATQSHLEQHARVLRALHCLHPSVMTGQTSSARHIGGQLLIDWFQLHHDTMDQASFVWISCSGRRVLDELLEKSKSSQPGETGLPHGLPPGLQQPFRTPPPPLHP